MYSTIYSKGVRNGNTVQVYMHSVEFQLSHLIQLKKKPAVLLKWDLKISGIQSTPGQNTC